MGPRAVRSSRARPSGACAAKSSRCSFENSLRTGSSPASAAFTSVGGIADFSVPEHTKPPGSASTSTRKSRDRRSFAGRSPGTTGRSFTIESSPLPWTRRARTTTPCWSSVSSGVSKNTTTRICASSGSMPSASNVERCCDAATVSFSSMLSESFIVASSRASSSSENVGATIGVVVIGAPWGGVRERASPSGHPPAKGAHRCVALGAPARAGAGGSDHHLEVLELDDAGPVEVLCLDHGLDLRGERSDRLQVRLELHVPLQHEQAARRAARALFVYAVLALVAHAGERGAEARQGDREEHERADEILPL